MPIAGSAHGCGASTFRPAALVTHTTKSCAWRAGAPARAGPDVSFVSGRSRMALHTSAHHALGKTIDTKRSAIVPKQVDRPGPRRTRTQQRRTDDVRRVLRLRAVAIHAHSRSPLLLRERPARESHQAARALDPP